MRFGRIQSQRWQTLKLADGDFEVQVSRPTAAERYRETAYALAAGKDLVEKVTLEEMQSRYRMIVAITGWRGLQDEKGEPIEFSEKALDALCSAYPMIFHELAVIATRAFRLGWDAEPDPDAVVEPKDADAPGN